MPPRESVITGAPNAVGARLARIAALEQQRRDRGEPARDFLFGLPEQLPDGQVAVKVAVIDTRPAAPVHRVASRLDGEPLWAITKVVTALAGVGLTVWGAMSLVAWVRAHPAQTFGWVALVALLVAGLVRVTRVRETAGGGCRWLLVHLCGGGK